MNEKQKEILIALSQGKKLKRIGNSLKWENVKGPSLENPIVSPLFRDSLISPDYKAGLLKTIENATGYIILTETGKIVLRHQGLI